MGAAYLKEREWIEHGRSSAKPESPSGISSPGERIKGEGGRQKKLHFALMPKRISPGWSLQMATLRPPPRTCPRSAECPNPPRVAKQNNLEIRTMKSNGNWRHGFQNNLVGAGAGRFASHPPKCLPLCHSGAGGLVARCNMGRCPCWEFLPSVLSVFICG